MLNRDALSQLSQLKADIQSSKEYAQGTVAATNGRFGFVRLENGGDAYLSPEKMQKLLPGDRVKVSLITNEKGQIEAELESLLEPALERFIGQYKIKGRNHFVVPIDNGAGRWVFLPPKARGTCKADDYVVARLTQHPFKDGKSQAKVLAKIGADNAPFFERTLIAEKYNLSLRKNEKVDAQTQTIQQQIDDVPSYQDGREDLTHLPFITIDSAKTEDMDDAIYGEKSEDGNYKIIVAIADPAHFIQRGSPIAYQAERSAQTVYLLGGAVPMLPKQLANRSFSLQENQTRPALTCHFEIDAQGLVKTSHFSAALIKSHKKLCYASASQQLNSTEDSDTLPKPVMAVLQTLQEATRLRQNYRKTHEWVNPEQFDYEFSLDAKGKITGSEKRPKTLAHMIVEECMIATNMAAGKFLGEHQAGLHMTHGGFREDRIGEVKALLKEEGFDLPENLNDAADHLKLLNAVKSGPQEPNLLPAVRRFMQIAELSEKSAKHFGMGGIDYATVTSPIRRFADLFNHWAIHAILSKQATPTLKEGSLASIKEQLGEGRKADRELQQWLTGQYAKSLSGQSFKGKIRIITQQGFGVRIDDNGIDGFVTFPKQKEKKYDAKRMTLTVEGEVFHLEKEVWVTVGKVDIDKRRIAYSLSKDQPKNNQEPETTEDAPSDSKNSSEEKS